MKRSYDILQSDLVHVSKETKNYKLGEIGDGFQPDKLMLKFFDTL